MGEHSQLGLVAVASCAEYSDNTIRKHEFTRPAKEDDRDTAEKMFDFFFGAEERGVASVQAGLGDRHGRKGTGYALGGGPWGNTRGGERHLDAVRPEHAFALLRPPVHSLSLIRVSI